MPLKLVEHPRHLTGKLAQHVVAAAQQQLGLLGLGDVGHGADFANGAAVAVAQNHHAAIENPLPAAVLATQSMFAAISAFISASVCQQRRLDGCHIVRMNQILPVLQFPPDIVRCVAEHRLPIVGQTAAPGAQVALPDAVTGRLQRQPEAFVLGLEAFTQALLLAMRLGLAQLSLHRRNQPGHAVLGDVVLRAGLHQLYRRFLTNQTGKHDERQVEFCGPNDPQGIQRVKSGKIVVGQHQVPAVICQRLLQRRE